MGNEITRLIFIMPRSYTGTARNNPGRSSYFPQDFVNSRANSIVIMFSYFVQVIARLTRPNMKKTKFGVV